MVIFDGIARHCRANKPPTQRPQAAPREYIRHSDPSWKGRVLSFLFQAFVLHGSLSSCTVPGSTLHSVFVFPRRPGRKSLRPLRWRAGYRPVRKKAACRSNAGTGGMPCLCFKRGQDGGPSAVDPRGKGAQLRGNGKLVSGKFRHAKKEMRRENYVV